MVTYQIEGIPSTFRSKDQNFERDVNRLFAKYGKREIKIIENDTEYTYVSTGDTSDSERGSLPENSADPISPAKSKRRKKTSDVQPVPDVLDDFNLSDDSITDPGTFLGSDLQPGWGFCSGGSGQDSPKDFLK